MMLELNIIIIISRFKNDISFQSILIYTLELTQSETYIMIIKWNKYISTLNSKLALMESTGPNFLNLSQILEAVRID